MITIILIIISFTEPIQVICVYISSTSDKFYICINIININCCITSFLFSRFCPVLQP